MKTTTKDPNRALIAACLGSMGMAASWLQQAQSAIAQGQDLNGFVASAHVSNRRKAKAAYACAIEG